MAVVDLTELPALLPRYSALIGLDLGEKTIGVAVSDVTRMVGSPLELIRKTKFTAEANRLFALIDDIRTVFELENSRRVVYDRPYGDVLPTYHRLDASIEKTWTIRRASITLQGSAINLYDRRNIFYVDIFTLRRTDQLPFLPSVGLQVEFE